MPKKEKTEKEQRYESSVAGEGAHAKELDLDESERVEEIAGDVKETKESPAEKKLRLQEEREEKEAEEEREKAEKAAAKNLTSTTAAEKAATTTTAPPKAPNK